MLFEGSVIIRSKEVKVRVKVKKKKVEGQQPAFLERGRHDWRGLVREEFLEGLRLFSKFNRGVICALPTNWRRSAIYAATLLVTTSAPAVELHRTPPRPDAPKEPRDPGQSYILMELTGQRAKALKPFAESIRAGRNRDAR